MRNYAYQIRQLVSMRAVAERYGVSVTKQNKALCPFHQDTKPSMHIYDGTKGWYCFVCNQGGDVIDFVRKMFGMSFRRAQEKINDDFMLNLPIASSLSDKERKEANRAYQKRQAEQNRLKQREKHLWTEYHAALDKWVALDIIKREEAPKTPLDGFNERYIYAAKSIDGAWADVECALDMLFRLESEEK